MARVKVINKGVPTDNSTNGYFNDTPSNTIFSFGKFFVTTNFDNKETVNYSNSLSSFVRPVTLETLGVNEIQSKIIQTYTTNAVLNLDKSDLNTYVRYGSAYEFLRTSIQNIIVAYPGSLFANSQKSIGGNITYEGLTYNNVTNIATFYVPTGSTVNTFGLVFNDGNTSTPDDNKLKNLNISYGKYAIWSSLEPNKLFKVVGYTGNSVNSSLDFTGVTGGTYAKKDYLKIQVEGNPFALIGTDDTARLNYHIRPNNVQFEEFRAVLNTYEQNIVSQRDGSDGFIFTLKDPTLLEDGKIIYSDSEIVWGTSDGYNVDVNTPTYQRFLKIMLTIGTKYDKIKTDLIARFLTPASLKMYDYTEEGKITKLLRVYGREFDQIRQFIDSLVNINKVTYNKQNNIPDQLIKNMANTFGWDYFSLVNEGELIDGFLTVDDIERDLNEDILPAEIDIELWRRIINNTSYFWKSKGTRQAIKSMFLLIGIPEPFINITEYVYTVDGKINPNSVPLAQADFPSNSLPYDNSGYPVAPLETNNFYFQLSGNSDSGQAYLDVFRMAGFNLSQTADNKKSWVQSGTTTRIHSTTPQYYQEDSRLVINTKEVDVSLDTARGIEFDVYEYIQKDFAANSSGYTLPYSYVNISNLTRDVNKFTLPIPTTGDYHKLGDMEVRYNGILLNAPSTGDTSSYTTGNTVTGATAENDYYVSGNTITIPQLSGGVRPTDVVQVTFVNSGETSVAAPTSAITINYIVTRIKAVLGGTYVPLPKFPHGDVQLTINGIALTKGTPQFTADYILDPANTTGSSQIIIQNPDVIAYLNQNPDVQISYMHVEGSNDINLRSEVIRIDSFNSSKIYFNNSANKYVYKLNYKVNQASDVKFLVDGIALEPLTDYNINVQNPYEIFLPKGLRFGTVISAYYLVGGAGAFNPVINDAFGLGDISELSFLEFLELVQRKMINARTRKVVTDFKGGWYPTILKLYETYLERALLPANNPLHSNGYTFENLYPFLSKYNAFFQRFVDQLLSATIILRRGGLLIRNSVFTQQKHWYKRGVNVIDKDDFTKDLRGNSLLQYFGDDGSKFQIIQGEIAPPPPPPTPTVLYVETTEGVLGSLTTGGEKIEGYEEVVEYGIDYKQTYPYPYGTGLPIGLENLLEGIDFEIEELANDWIRISETESLENNSFTMTLTGLDYDTSYDYRAFIESPTTGATGNVRQITTDPAPLPTPSLVTRPSLVVGNSLTKLGASNVVRYEDVEYYAVQYREAGTTNWNTSPSPPETGPLSADFFGVPNVTGLDYDTTYEYRAYMLVDSTSYHGATRTATIGARPYIPYDVTTGTRVLIGNTGRTLGIDENTYSVASAYPTNIMSYGVVYTQDSSQATEANLKITNTNTAVKETYLTLPASSPFLATIAGLTPDVLTYFRAFVKNGTVVPNNSVVGYGEIESAIPTGGIIVPTGFNVSIGLEWLGTTTGQPLGTIGIDGVIKLMDGSTEVDRITISSPLMVNLVIFSNVDPGTYTVDLSGLVGNVGPAVRSELRWKNENDFNYNYSTSIVPNVSSIDNNRLTVNMTDGAWE